MSEEIKLPEDSLPRVTLYNDSPARMTVMALGKAVEWNPKTTMIVSEREAEKLLKVGDHIKKYEDLAANASEVVSLLNKEIADLKAENEALKAKIAELEKAGKKGK